MPTDAGREVGQSADVNTNASLCPQMQKERWDRVMMLTPMPACAHRCREVGQCDDVNTDAKLCPQMQRGGTV